MDGSSTRIYIAGDILTPPEHSHICRGEAFSRLTIGVSRLSGTVDELPLLLPSRLLEADAQGTLWALGQLRAYMRADGGQARLQLSVFSRAAGLGIAAHENAAELYGYICKPPVLRTTPRGRVLTDLFIAVNRPFGRADYLPVIVWGEQARLAAALSPGDFVHVTGRLQSRVYEKQLEDGGVLRRTVHELSGSVERLPPP